MSAPPPPTGNAPVSQETLMKVKSMAAPQGPAPSGLPPGLLARVKISREEVNDNDESFANDNDKDGYHNDDEHGREGDGEGGDRYRDDDDYGDRDRDDRRYDDEDSYDRDYGRGRNDGDREDDYYNRDDDRDHDRDRDRGRDRDDDRYRSGGRDYDDEDDSPPRRGGGGGRGGRGSSSSGRREYDSDEGYQYSEDEEEGGGRGSRQQGGAGAGGGGKDLSERAQPKSSVIDLQKQAPYNYVSMSRIPQAPAGTKQNIFNFRPILKATYRELRNFVLSPVEPGTVVRCYIERSRNGTDAFAPAYSLCADLEDGTGRELMVCKKVFYSSSSHYVFSLKAEDLYRRREQRSRLYLGKLRLTGKSTYTLYDNGNVSMPESKGSGGAKGGDDDDDDDDAPPPEDKGDKKSDEVSLYRKELAIIYNNTNKRPAPAGVRGTEVCIPATYLNADEQLMRRNNSVGASLPDTTAQGKGGKAGGVAHHVSTVPKLSGTSMAEPFGRVRAAGKQNVKQTGKVFVLHERTSKYDPLSSCLVDFKSRATIPSVKNCQFVESSPQDGAKAEQMDDHEKGFLLQMGKTTEDCFNMDTQYPMCLLQSFAICIARFDAQLKW